MEQCHEKLVPDAYNRLARVNIIFQHNTNASGQWWACFTGCCTSAAH